MDADIDTSRLRRDVYEMPDDVRAALIKHKVMEAYRQRPAYQLWSVRNHDIWDSIGASGRIDAYLSHRSDGVLDQFRR